MSGLERVYRRGQRGVGYAWVLLQAALRPEQRRLLGEVLALGRQLPPIMDGALPDALAQLTPVEQPQQLDFERIRLIVDAATGFGAGRPLGICLRRSLLRYYFLRRAGLPVMVHFGARRIDLRIGGHAWLTLHGEPYHERPEHIQGYALMASFPSSGGP